jgi:hypothetical protein
MTVDLTTNQSIDFSNDSIVIVKNLETIPGGKSLDLTGFAPLYVKAGHVIIVETANGNHKPLPVTDLIPEDHTYVGVLVATVLASSPLAAIMVRGTVDKAAMEYPADSVAIAALPLIRFA